MRTLIITLLTMFAVAACAVDNPSLTADVQAATTDRADHKPTDRDIEIALESQQLQPTNGDHTTNDNWCVNIGTCDSYGCYERDVCCASSDGTTCCWEVSWSCPFACEARCNGDPGFPTSPNNPPQEPIVAPEVGQ